MILIHRLINNDIESYFKEYIQSLNINLNNKIISKIVIFCENTNIEFPKNTKIIIINKKNYSIYDCIQYTKKIIKKENYIFANPFAYFDDSLVKLTKINENKVIILGSYCNGIFNQNSKDAFIFKWNSLLNQNSNDDVSSLFNCLFIDLSKNILVNNNRPWNIVKSTSLKIPNLENNKENTQVLRKVGEKKIYEKNSPTIRSKKIDILIVSVNYNDYLLLSLNNNIKYFENITIITSSDDILCQKICDKFGVVCLVTDTMYDNGDYFNKGKAINFGLQNIENPDLVLILDADIVITKEIDLDKLNDDVFYYTGRYFCNNYESYHKWENNEIELSEIGEYESHNGLGYFQLFKYDSNKLYPENFKDASWSDLIFRDKYTKRIKLDYDVIHLGDIAVNWKGRKTERFANDDVFYKIISQKNEIEIIKNSKHLEEYPKYSKNDKSSYTICSYYFNFNNDERQKNNFEKFIRQFKGHYNKMVIGTDVDLDFKVPCKKVIIENNNNLWSKEIIINKILEEIDTEFIIWIDGDIIYDNLDWLNNLDQIDNSIDFIQLFDTINYLDEKGNIIESFKSIASESSNKIDILLGKGYKPGGAWLGRTSILKEKGIFEKMYVGGGDTIFVYGLFGITNGWTLKEVGKYNEEIYLDAKNWIENFGVKKISYLPVTVNHLYHGDLKDRNYSCRYKKLETRKYTYKYIYMIPSYNRYDKLLNIINHINSYSKECLIIIVNDHSNDIRYVELKKIENLIYIENEVNYSKEKFWKTVNKLFNEAKKYKFEYGIMIADDFIFVENFEIKLNKYKINNRILSLFRQNNVTLNWGYSNWIDGAFCAPFNFFKDLNFEIHQTFIKNKYSSSGVGQQMTKRLNELGWEVDFFGSLIKHNDNNISVMHPELRKKEPLLTIDINNQPVIVCGIATIYDRRDSLRETIESIIDQVDKLIVYQNGYKEFFEFLKNDKIELISSIDTGIDMGDAGKFYCIDKYKDCYYLSIDDDLIYPKNYVNTLISKLMEYNDEIIVTFHGRILKTDAKSYYKDHYKSFRCLDNVENDEFVHFGGTGVMGFHTNIVKMKFEQFKYPNMADIWFGLFASYNKIPILCTSHKKNWIKHSSLINEKETIYYKSKNKDNIQNLAIQEFDKNIIIKYKKDN
jgi:hypothetical protein